MALDTEDNPIYIELIVGVGEWTGMYMYVYVNRCVYSKIES